jgi:acylphosphatase
MAQAASNASHRHTCYFSGRVQGVGFRYTTQNLALRYNVGGYVRNLPDGRVELVVEGPDAEVDNFIGSINDRMGDYIKAMNQSVDAPTGEYRQFYIRH